MDERRKSARLLRRKAAVLRGVARARAGADPGTPMPQGLYDPALDKDSCGVGFIADIKGRKSHQIVEDGLKILCNLEHRGAVGADPRMGDGAGILVQIPHKFFAKEAARLGFTLPEPGEYAVGYLFMPRDAELAADRPRHLCRGDRARGAHAASAGATCRPTIPRSANRSSRPSRCTCRCSSAAARRSYPRTSSSAGSTSCASRSPTPSIAGASGARRGYYPVSISCRTVIYKGMFLADQLGDLLSRSARSGFRERARAGASALLDQHIPDLVAGASLPLDRAQRRDQHAARQHQLDGGAAGERGLAAVRQGHQQAVADFLRGPVRHRLLRQCARIPGAGRLLARACHDDDDSRGLGGQSAHGRGAARLLRIQRRADGAVGRPGGDRLHQRPPDRRHARPQRPAAGALSAHRRRPHRHGVGNRRAADPGKEHRQEVAAAAGQDAAGRSRRGPAHSRRGIEGDAGAQPPLQGVARQHPDRAGRPAGHRQRSADVEPAAARSPADVRLHAGRPEIPDVADGHHRRGSGRLDGQRHADLGAVGQAEAAVHLFQAELRAGDQPADRPDPRRAGDEPGLHHRAAAESVRPGRLVQDQAAGSAPADPHQ